MATPKVPMSQYVYRRSRMSSTIKVDESIETEFKNDVLAKLFENEKTLLPTYHKRMLSPELIEPQLLNQK